MEDIRKKKASKKTSKRTTIGDLEERLNRLTSLVEKLVVAPEEPRASEQEAKQVVEQVVERKVPPLEKGKTYIFCSGPHKGMQLRLSPGRRSDANPVTGEYTLIPPEFADFGEMDGSSGPAGFYVTRDLEKVKKIREALAQIVTSEIVEVTGDPAYDFLIK